jgi:hypothetical protein
MRFAWVQRVFLVLIVAASLYAAAHNLASTADLGSPQDDPVADWEKRFAPVRQRLPFARGVIGYISDSDVPGAAYDPANDEGEYVLTQYALAPIVIVRGTSQEWNLANLTRDSYGRWRAGHAAGFEIVFQQNGLYLLHRNGN